MFPSFGGNNCLSTVEGSYMYNHDHNLNSRQGHEDSSHFLHFPPSFLDEDDEDTLLTQWLSQQHQRENTNETEGCMVTRKKPTENSTSNIMADEQEQMPEKSDCKKKIVAKPKKRSGKKDTHSKIYTAHGPRDRRMRLSLQIARRFFDLQDMLGFDKASKTIEWLLIKSRSAIKELAKNLQQSRSRSNSPKTKRKSSTSENEMPSDSDIKKGEDDTRDQELNKDIDEHEQTNMVKLCEEKLRKLPKESRDKARARARERTREKIKSKRLHESSEASPSSLEQQEIGHNMDSGNQEMQSSMMAMKDQEKGHIDSLNNIDKVIGFAGSEPIFPSSLASNFSHNVAPLSDFQGENAGSWSDRHATTIMKHLITGNVLLDNPNASSNITFPNSIQEKMPSLFCVPGAQNFHSGSVVMTNSVARQETSPIFRTRGNPSSVRQEQLPANQYS